ncbi:hypothetical protein OCU04_012925 [Sclerotinia nivalis]|uniref:Uncharacterized protein n=1 Tax=Sclerotinia nivalis TaxID=352851 RepID=A0A9X0DC83_9HELO|nr:hypothetical protein OCU04_012925 [Sclerotinia nivalis]
MPNETSHNSVIHVDIPVGYMRKSQTNIHHVPTATKRATTPGSEQLLDGLRSTTYRRQIYRYMRHYSWWRIRNPNILSGNSILGCPGVPQTAYRMWGWLTALSLAWMHACPRVMAQSKTAPGPESRRTS